MKIIFKKCTILGCILALMISCTNDFDEINTDPDALNGVPYTNILGYVLENTAKVYGNDLDGFGTYCGYIAKIQYIDDLGDAIPSNNTWGNRWSNCYSMNGQLKDVLNATKEEAETYKNLRWACRIFSTYLWLMNVDQYGAMPYTDALKSVDNLTPSYDDENVIYPALLDTLKTIADEMAKGFGNDKVGEGDLLFNGNVEKWQRFNNSLLLRGAMRISSVYSNAQKIVETIAGNPEKYPLIDNNANNAYFWWQGSGDYYEQWYENSRSRDDHGFFDTFIKHLETMKDPRLPVIAHLTTTDSTYRGIENGVFSTPSDLGLYSRIGTMFRDDPDGFTPFYKACETYYILAEAAQKGWNVGITAQDAYEKAVKLSMDDMGISEEKAATYLAGKGAWNGTIERIWWDQWIALFKENWEAWCLFRRTGIPTNEVNYVSHISVYGNDHNTQPFRVQYPSDESLYNSENYEKASENIVDYVWGKQLWWDTRKDVH